MIPLWLKLGYTIFVFVTVVIYARAYRPQNFLWFSDIALLVSVPALWLESPLLAGMMTVGVLLPELFWNIDFFIRLITGRRLSGLTDYMFDPQKPLYLRALSFFHVFLPALLLWMVAQLGYAPTAWLAQTALTWVVLPLTYRLSDPDENVNWVYGPRSRPQKSIPPLAYLGLLMIAFPVIIYLPTHFILEFLFD